MHLPEVPTAALFKGSLGMTARGVILMHRFKLRHCESFRSQRRHCETIGAIAASGVTIWGDGN